MQITVLGSSGSEGPGQNPPGFLLDDFILFDAGTVSLSLDRDAQCKITHIFLTHAHLDHIKAIPFLVDNIVGSKQNCHVFILSAKDVLADLKNNIFNNRIWPDFTLIPAPECSVMSYQEISSADAFEVRDYRIYMTRVHHASVPAYGYMIEDRSGDVMVYTGDTGPTEEIWKRMEGRRVKLLITEVSFPNEMLNLALTSGHLTPSLLEAEIRKMPVIPEKICITHLKPYYKDVIVTELAGLPGPELLVLEDGMTLSV